MVISFANIGVREREQLRIARAFAIENYASVEHVLCQIFSHLLGTPIKTGALVFFKIASARARNTIISDLLRKEHERTYDLFWHGKKDGQNDSGGLFKLIRQLDHKRNEIIHWTFMSNINANSSGNVTHSTHLSPPSSIYQWPFDTKIGREELEEFSDRAVFVAIVASMFNAAVLSSLAMPKELRESWKQICQQSVIYPPPNNHPLSPTHTALQTQRQSFRASAQEEPPQDYDPPEDA